MSKERSDSMETTRSHSQLLIEKIYPVSLKKQRAFSLFFWIFLFERTFKFDR